MPDIGRKTNFPQIRVLFVDNYGIEYQKRNDSILVINIYSCMTNPALRGFVKDNE